VLINKSITIIKYAFEKKQETYVNEVIWSRNKDHLHDYIQWLYLFESNFYLIK